MKPIVFVSSVSEEYKQIRQAARKAIEKAGGQPIGFEDFSAKDKSSRNASLDGVRDCDVY
jgi:ABC-type branched-subunit amino acid transport system substrate-binding protein